MHSSIGVGETMKTIVAKGIQTEMGNPYGGTGYVTEKMYMLLQLYLQNKGWNQVELLQYMSEMKDGAMLPSAAYLQMMASRITLDSQGRLILRENGKIILPFEHFANAVMLKHMNGPHGLHLGMEGTLRAVMESYTIGRENFGMEKEFVIEVVNNCPNPACRFYKSQLDISHSKPTYIPEPSTASGGGSSMHSRRMVDHRPHESTQEQPVMPKVPEVPPSRLISQPPPPQPIPPPAPHGLSGSSMGEGSSSSQNDIERVVNKGTPLPPTQSQHKLTDFLKSNIDNLDSLNSANKVMEDLLAVHNGAWLNQEGGDGKRHASSNTEVGQEKIVRAFTEIMKNMSRIKTFVRPAMCKPYGKQSEALQKTIMDTIQLVQSLRSILPPPHIAVSSWKNEDKHRRSVPGLEELCDSVRKVD